MSSESEENRLLAGPILGAVGGLVTLAYGAYEISLAEGAKSVASLGGFPVGNVAGAVDAGVAGVVLGLITICAAVGLWVSPRKHAALGALIIVLSVLSLVSVGGGNGAGLILGVLGGTCGVVIGPGHPYTGARGEPPSGAAAGAHFTRTGPPTSDTK